MTNFPQELINLVVEAYANQGSPVHSLLSVSRTFRSPARRLLFSKVTTKWNVGYEYQNILPWPKFDLLMQMLSDSPELLQFIEEITFRLEWLPRNLPDPPRSNISDSLVTSTAEVLSKAPIRALALVGEPDHQFPWTLTRILLGIRRNPSFRSLTISSLDSVPPQLILGRAPGDGLTSLEISFCSMSLFEAVGPLSISSPTQHIPGLTLTNLRHLTVCHGTQREPGDFLLLRPLRTPPPPLFRPDTEQATAKLFPSLKTLHLTVTNDWQAVLQALGSVMKNAPVLEILHLEEIEIMDGFDFEQLADENAVPRPFAQLRRFEWTRAFGLRQVAKSLDGLASFVERFGRVGSPLVELVLNLEATLGFSPSATTNALVKTIFRSDENMMSSPLERLSRAVSAVGSTSVEKVEVNMLLRLIHAEGDPDDDEFGSPKVCMDELTCKEVEQKLSGLVAARFAALASIKKVSVGIEIHHD